MERESFIFYRSFYEAIKELDSDSQLQLYYAICEKALYGNDVSLDNIPKAMFALIKPQLEANTKRYCDGKKGGRPKEETTGYEDEITTGFENEKPNNNENVNVNDNVNENDIYTPSETEVSSGDIAKASKHKYGEYKHVLLKDEELQALKRDYPNWEELIRYLDEYIEMKGYKAKSHYLCIKKWVVDAVKKTSPKGTKNQVQNPSFGDLSKFYAN